MKDLETRGTADGYDVTVCHVIEMLGFSLHHPHTAIANENELGHAAAVERIGERRQPRASRTLLLLPSEHGKSAVKFRSFRMFSHVLLEHLPLPIFLQVALGAPRPCAGVSKD